MNKIQELLENKDLAAKLSTCVDADKVKSVLKEFNADLNDVEVQQLIGILKTALSDENLEEVAGGEFITFRNGEMILP